MHHRPVDHAAMRYFPLPTKHKQGIFTESEGGRAPLLKIAFATAIGWLALVNSTSRRLHTRGILILREFHLPPYTPRTFRVRIRQPEVLQVHAPNSHSPPLYLTLFRVVLSPWLSCRSIRARGTYVARTAPPRYPCRMYGSFRSSTCLRSASARLDPSLITLTLPQRAATRPTSPRLATHESTTVES